MRHSGGSDIIRAQRLLADFEQKQTSNGGIACLVDALAILSDIIEDPDNEQERRVARNLFDSHSRSLKDKAISLLAKIDDMTDEEVEKWFTALQEFNGLPIQVSDEFGATLQQLIKALFDRYFRQLSPARQAEIMDDLKQGIVNKGL